MSQGMLGMLPLSAVRGPRATLDELLAGPEGPRVLEELKLFNKKKPCWVEEAKEGREPRSRLDNRIEVDRFAQLVYPEFMEKTLYPDFEAVGPSKYRLNKVGLWLHPGQEIGVATGNVIHRYLRDQEMLKDCLGLADAIEIQKKGIEVYRKFFGGKSIHFWKSVVRGHDGVLRVPSLFEARSEVMLEWHWLSGNWGDSSPAVRFVG